MISKDKGDKFEELKYSCERFSNNNQPELTDQEINDHLFVRDASTRTF